MAHTTCRSVPKNLFNPQAEDLEQLMPFLTGCGAASPTEDSMLWNPMILHCSDGAANDSTKQGKRYTVDDTFDGSLDHALSYVEAWELVDDAALCGYSTWASFEFNDIVPPCWWPGTMQENIVVPSYNKLIITRGFVAGIGLHRDTDPVGKTGEPVVATFLTILKGRKRVLMLPPGDSAVHAHFTKSPFPTEPSAIELNSIVDAGGFLFDLTAIADESEVPQTLFVPKGWWHWLISSSECTAIVTASVYDRRT